MPLLRQYLQQQADRGQTHVLLNAEARKKLQELAKDKGGAVIEPAPMNRPSAPIVPMPDRIGSDTPPMRVLETEPAVEVSGGTREEKLAHLAQKAEDHQPARALGTLRGVMVFAMGNPEADVMFIGEAPGAEEERQREPFVGPAGQLLTKIITAMGLKRTEVYISNICKFRPAIEKQGSANRKPTPEEMRTCLPFILAEIDIVQPKVIVALGGTAAEGLGINGPVTRNRGRLHSIKDIPVVVTYHPSYLLRQEQEGRGIEAKRQSWEDMLLAMGTAGLPITEKQRGFFKGR